MPFYTITEPHPTVAQNSYTHSGRGGAGNIFRAPATTPATGVPTLTQTRSNDSVRSSVSSTSTSSGAGSRFYSGRGGAGNAHAAAERPVISFDEEYALADAAARSTRVGYVGRGGAGNTFSSARKDGDAASGVRSGFWGRLTGDRH